MDEEGEAGFHDKRIINLAAEVSDAPDHVVPRLLLQLQGKYLGTFSTACSHLSPVKCYQLIPYMYMYGMRN